MRKHLLACAVIGPIFVSAAAHGQSAGPVQPAARPAKTLTQRIGHTDPTRYRRSEGVHAGAGSMEFAPIFGTDALSTNLIFVHRGVIAPRSGIGEHFHNNCEEMFVILDGEAQFTINGHTSLIKGPAAVPDRMGHAHGIYNPTDKPVQWVNINVGLTKTYDAFNLDDPRTDVALDPIPQFISARFDPAQLRPVAGMDGGDGTVQYRRAFEPSVFSTPWSYVDHLRIPPGASVGTRTMAEMSEVYLVISGDGEVAIGSETAPIHIGDVVPVDLGQSRSIRSTGATPLDMMVIGVAKDLASKASYMAAQAARPRAAR
ncbi:cupin domain-containing protein [Sphingomonas sp. QA11]|uniref:cupin domain-containing protein n=1 Tax=Sphingomonas sp. QA11 TaxID=2950605 RepID=UPI00234943CB|nr:cupin domain-containing protein [Sphingomonas sp. QA11]WCM26642.1 cupin domain-containing protein [Sphingomonas sp. QA11]